MRSHTWIRWVAVAGVASLALTGCSSDKTEGAADDKRTTLDSIMGAPDYENFDWEAQQQEIEELVAKCMAEEGWEYTPVTYPDSGVDVEFTDEDELEYIKREGLGVTYYLLNDPSDEAVIDDGRKDFVDPNQAYVESLSEVESAGYYGSLYGTQKEQEAASTMEIDPETGDEYPVVSGSLGCQGEAYDAVAGDDITQSPGYYEAMDVYRQELQERIDSDPRMVKLTDQWVSCMADEGFEYEDVEAYYNDVFTDFQARVDEIIGADFYNYDPMEGWTQERIDEFYATATDVEMNELYSYSARLTGEQRTQLEAIHEEEVSVALAQFNCSKDLEEKGLEIYAEIEEQYALEHEDELIALAATLAEEE